MPKIFLRVRGAGMLVMEERLIYGMIVGLLKILLRNYMDNSLSKIHSLIDFEGKQWNISILREIVNPKLLVKILAMPIVITIAKDKIIWLHTKYGEYTVKDGY